MFQTVEFWSCQSVMGVPDGIDMNHVWAPGTVFIVYWFYWVICIHHLQLGYVID